MGTFMVSFITYFILLGEFSKMTVLGSLCLIFSENEEFGVNFSENRDGLNGGVLGPF